MQVIPNKAKDETKIAQEGIWKIKESKNGKLKQLATELQEIDAFGKISPMNACRVGQSVFYQVLNVGQ